MARDIRILTETDLRQLVSIDLEAVKVVERAFAALATDEVVMPPVLSMEIASANGEVDVKTAFIPDCDQFAIKVSPGFFDNPKMGLPSLNGLMIAFSARTGLVEAVLLDNGYLTDVRTAAAGAVSALHLAPEIETAGVIGTGFQARLQMQAAHLVRPFRKVLVWGRDQDKATACARDIGERLGIEATVEPDRARLVAQSQLVVTATPSHEPLIHADWLHPGMHITAMGADQSGKNEVDPSIFSRLDVYVPDRLSQCETLGELRAALAAGTLADTSGIKELGEIISDPTLGRQTFDQITLCDLTGTGAQDTAIASFALARARKESAGTQIRA